jgi:eukaryotic-like serine/threonine-protein kinase
MTDAVSNGPQSEPRRYEVLMQLASGGMATVYIGYLRGGLGFRQVVAIKRPHKNLLEDPAFRRTFVAEAYLASQLHHTNVVDVRDVDVSSDSVDLVMDYIEGASLSRLLDTCRRKNMMMPPAIALRIVIDAALGLHAAHEATDELGQPLELVHRDVSPQNILIGVDGVARVTDFGIAKCMHGGDVTTQAGVLKGKLGYMAPEYLSAQRLDRRADIWALGVVLWEALTMRRMFTGRRQVDTIRNIQDAPVPRLDELGQPLGKRLDEVLEHVLERNPDARFERAIALANALETVALNCAVHLTHGAVAAFVQQTVGEELDQRRAAVRERLGARASRLPDDPNLRQSARSSSSGSHAKVSSSNPSLQRASPSALSDSPPGVSYSGTTPPRAASPPVRDDSVTLPMTGPRLGWFVLAAVVVFAIALVVTMLFLRARAPSPSTPSAPSVPAGSQALPVTSEAAASLWVHQC